MSVIRLKYLFAGINIALKWFARSHLFSSVSFALLHYFAITKPMFEDSEAQNLAPLLRLTRGAPSIKHLPKNQLILKSAWLFARLIDSYFPFSQNQRNWNGLNN